MMRSDKSRLQHVLDATVEMGEYVRDMELKDFLADRKTQSAVMRQLEIIGEAIKHVSKGIREKHPDVRWNDFADLRDALIHEYFRLKLEEAWKIVTEDVPRLREQVEGILAEPETS
ncbi:MAG: DUF86 domain-containing protein [Hadesarchaea archaeon]|nr:DUF86 domain-containing protein [Hadesarchaea archaeon]